MASLRDVLDAEPLLDHHKSQRLGSLPCGHEALQLGEPVQDNMEGRHLLIGERLDHEEPSSIARDVERGGLSQDPAARPRQVKSGSGCSGARSIPLVETLTFISASPAT